MTRRITVQVWWSSLVAADRSLLELLDATERARVCALQRSADQGRSLVAAALLRVVVGEQLHVPPGEVQMDRTCGDCGRPHGRPRVVGPGGAGPHVSVSHSGLLVAVALSEDTPVGIDVQRVADAEQGVDSTGAVPSVESWVRREAMLKLGCADAPLRVRSLRAPLHGYAAALATLTDRSATDVELRVWRWRPPTPA